MKRIVILVVIALVLGVSLYADEATVIDFNKLVADYPSDKPVNNQATITDFSSVAGSSFSQAEKDQMKTSLAIQNWDVLLNSSANSVVNAANSFTRPTKVKASAVKYPNETILGIRIFFPTESVNAVAFVKPPFEIPAYADKETVGANGALTVAAEDAGKGAKFDGFGVVKNVGVLKSVSVNAFGLNFPNSLTVVFKDQNNKTYEYFLDYLNFDGWKTLTWSNPNYITDVRDREIKTFPLYPQSFPLLKLEGFKIYKDSTVAGGDFVGYIKDVKIVFDKAILTLDRDIDDEATWNILQEREAARRNAELERLGQLQVLRFLENKKIETTTAQPAANP